MKFIHIADLHLGMSPDAGHPWKEERTKEIWDSFRRVIQKAEADQVELLLIAGDFFHRQPLLRELKEVNYLFSTLTATQVVLIAGNHDYMKDNSYYREFPWNENVTFLAETKLEKVVFSQLDTAVYGLSYHSREIREPLYDQARPDGQETYSILLAHGGDEKHIPMDMRRIQGAGFTYVAMGHIHKPHIFNSRQAAYPGDLEPLDKNDTGVRGYVEGILENGGVKIRFVPFSLREYVHLTLESQVNMTDYAMEEKIRHEIEEKGPQHIYKIILTGFRDPDIIYHLEEYKKLGNIIEVEDATRPAYDFRQLKALHGNDLMGRFLDRLLEDDVNEIQKKALFYGVHAMEQAKE